MDPLLANADTLLLLLCAGGALASAALMLVLQQPMRVAMALITTMALLGAVYGLLGVHFIAAFQILIYVGAVMVFMVFAIMLLEPRDAIVPRYSPLLVPGAAGLVVLLVALVVSVWRPLPSPVHEIGDTAYGIAGFALAFLREYWLLFELTSVLLVAAVVAALAVLRVGSRRGSGPPRG